MNKRIYILVLLALAAGSSCSLFWNKVNQTMEQAGEIQEKHADSLRTVIIRQAPVYAAYPVFGAKMDSVYASGFRLADLSDSLKLYPDDRHWQREYWKELKYFRNYVIHHFEYDDVIIANLSSLGRATQFANTRNNSKQVPDYMRNFNIQSLSAIMVKPAIMYTILACRKQYIMSDSTVVADY